MLTPGEDTLLLETDLPRPLLFLAARVPLSAVFCSQRSSGDQTTITGQFTSKGASSTTGLGQDELLPKWSQCFLPVGTLLEEVPWRPCSQRNVLFLTMLPSRFNTQSTGLTALCLPAGPWHFAGLCVSSCCCEMLSSGLDRAAADMNSRQLWL